MQRLFYWHVCKVFYDPSFTLEEMNHLNFDWFAPRFAHRQTPEEVREWCAKLGLEIEREQVEEMRASRSWLCADVGAPLWRGSVRRSGTATLLASRDPYLGSSR